MVTFYSMDNKGDMREVMIGKDLQSLSFDENSEDIITRLYIEGEYGDDGYIGIDDLNPTGLTYLTNFDYYKEVGLFTDEHQAQYDSFITQMSEQTQDIREYSSEVLEMANELNGYWGQPRLVQYVIDPETYTIAQSFKSTDEIDDADMPLKIGDVLHIVGPVSTYRKEVISNVSTFSFQRGDVYAVKYVTTEGASNAAGTIGAKEVSIEAKESAITQIERMKRQTTDPQKIAEYDQQIAEIQTQIQVIYDGVAETDVEAGTVQTMGLYEMYYRAMDQNVILQNSYAVLNTYKAQQADLESQFYMDMGDMQKDGYWSNQNYILGQEEFLYADAISVLEEMSKPKRTYTVNRIAISDVLGYDLNDFDVNTQVRIYDPYINVNDIVYVKKITRILDQWWKDKIELTNESITVTGKSLDSILQRITQVTNELENRKDVFSKVKALTNAGTVRMDRLEGTLDIMKNRIVSSVSSWFTDDNGNIMFEAADGQSAMKLSGDGWMIANGKTEEGEWNWRTAATGYGITADAIVTGYLSAEQIEAGSITGDKLDIHAGDSLDLSANNSVRVVIGEELDDMERSSGDNLLPGTSSSIRQVEIADEYIQGSVEIDTNEAGADTLTFRVYLAPAIDDVAPAIIAYSSSRFDEAIYDTSRFATAEQISSGTSNEAVYTIGDAIKAGEEGWAEVSIDLDEDITFVKAALINVTKEHTTTCDYHSAKVEYGPATPYTPSLKEVKREVSGLTIDMYEDSGKIETYRRSLNEDIEDNRNAIAEITPEYITESVSHLLTYGTRNYILNSTIKRRSSSDQITIYELAEGMTENRAYTLSLDFIPGSGVERIEVCVSQGAQTLGYIVPYGTSRQSRTLTFLAKYARQSSTTIDPDKQSAWDLVTSANNRSVTGLKTYIDSLTNNSIEAYNRNGIQGKRLVQESGYTGVDEDRTYYCYGRVIPITITTNTVTITSNLLLSAISVTGKYILTDAELATYTEKFASTEFQIEEEGSLVIDTEAMFEADEDRIQLSVGTSADLQAKAMAIETLVQIYKDMEEYELTTVHTNDYKTYYLDPTITVLDGDVDPANINLYLYARPSGATRTETTIYNAKLEKGNVSTGYTSAPEDNLYAGANLLRNGGFEMYRSDHYPLNWGLTAEGDRTTEDSVTHEEVVVAKTTFKVCGPNIDDDTQYSYRDPSVNTVIVNRYGEYLDGQRIGIYSDILNLSANTMYMFSGYASVKNATNLQIDVYGVDSSTGTITTVSTNTFAPKWGNQNLSTWRRFEIAFNATGDTQVSISAIGPTTNSSEDVVLMATKCKIEKGYFATEYSPCVLDSSDIVSRLTSAEQQITPEAIVSTVRERTTYDEQIGAANDSIRELRTTMSQTSDEFLAQIETVSNEAESALNEQDNKISTYIRFTEAGQELGKEGTGDEHTLKAMLTNSRLSFLQDGNEVAYISNNNLYITQTQILTSLEFGGIIATKDGGGSINWSWT